MRAFVFGTAILLASTPCGFADDVMAAFYGNTIVATTASSELHIHYRANHTFDASGTDTGGPIALKGSWLLDKKGRLCRNYDPPLPGKTNPVCTAWSAHDVGDTWEMPGVTLTLVQGVQ